MLQELIKRKRGTGCILNSQAGGNYPVASAVGMEGRTD